GRVRPAGLRRGLVRPRRCGRPGERRRSTCGETCPRWWAREGNEARIWFRPIRVRFSFAVLLHKLARQCGEAVIDWRDLRRRDGDGLDFFRLLLFAIGEDEGADKLAREGISEDAVVHLDFHVVVGGWDFVLLGKARAKRLLLAEEFAVFVAAGAEAQGLPFVGEDVFAAAARKEL